MRRHPNYYRHMRFSIVPSVFSYKKTVSYTHLDVYKRQLVATAVVYGFVLLDFDVDDDD